MSFFSTRSDTKSMDENMLENMAVDDNNKEGGDQEISFLRKLYNGAVNHPTLLLAILLLLVLFIVYNYFKTTEFYTSYLGGGSSKSSKKKKKKKVEEEEEEEDDAELDSESDELIASIENQQKN